MRKKPPGPGEDIHSANNHFSRHAGGSETVQMDHKHEEVQEDMTGTGRKSMEATRRLSGITQKSARQPSPSMQPAIEKRDTDTDTQLRPRAGQRSPWSCSLLTLACSVLSFVILAVIGHSFLSRQLDPKGCQMSYMRPAFAKFDDFDTEYTRFASKYSLYLYREGGIDEDTRVKGIPVLFIPGNAGSYKQVRPIAAEAANYFHEHLKDDEDALGAGKRTLDFFTVDFNEDITAFHGQTLLEQADYLNDAIAYILDLYQSPVRSLRGPNLPDPTSVIIIGHSMGGIVARTMLTRSNYLSNSINTILTLSAPHARAPISFDSDIVGIYQHLNDYWRRSYAEEWASKNPLWHVTLVSIAGGGLDTVVPSDYASLTSLVPETHGFTVFTSTIPHVWTGMDHLAIMWCDQFRKALIRALYDVADVRRPSQTRSRAERIQFFRKHFLTGLEPIIEKGLAGQEAKMLLALSGDSTKMLTHGERLVRRSFGSTSGLQAHIMPIPVQDPTHNKRFSLMTDQSLDGSGPLEVYLCNVQSHLSGNTPNSMSLTLDPSDGKSGATKLACKSAAVDAIALPGSTNTSRYAFDGASPFHYLQYDLPQIADYQFVAIVDTATEEVPGWVIAEFSDVAQSTVNVKKSLRRLLLRGVRRTLPPARSLVNEIHIPTVHSSLLAYTLDIDQSGEQPDELFRPLLRQYILEPYESKFFPNPSASINVNLHGISPYVSPPIAATETNNGLSLQIWSDPTCNNTMRISLQVDVLGSAGKLYMRYRTVFAAFPLLVVALILRKQFKVYNATGLFISFSEAMDLCIRTSLPLLFVALTFLALSLARAEHRGLSQGLLGKPSNGSESIAAYTRNELLLGSNDPFFWFLVPLFGLTSVGVCIAANYAVLLITYTFTAVYSRLRAVSLRSEDGRRIPATFAVTSSLQRLITTFVLLLLVATIIPYQFAYLVLCIVQLATCIRALRLSWESRQASNTSFYNYTHSLLILMLWILPINLPVLIVWIHNLAVHWLTPFSSHHNILSIMPFILLVELLSTGAMVPRLSTSLTNNGREGGSKGLARLKGPAMGLFTNVFLFSIAVFAAVYGVTYAYLLHQAVNGLCAWLMIIHIFGAGTTPAGQSSTGGGGLVGDAVMGAGMGKIGSNDGTSDVRGPGQTQHQPKHSQGNSSDEDQGQRRNQRWLVDVRRRGEGKKKP